MKRPVHLRFRRKREKGSSFFKMMEFIHTLCKGIIQGVNQFITNDLASYVPLFIIAAVILVIVKVKDLIQKFRK